MSTIHFTLNGAPAKAKAGSTILEAAEENGVFIPTLCHQKDILPFGACMLCRIKVKGFRNTLLACGTKLSEGMEIITQSPEIEKSRRVCLELILSEHYGDCVAPCTLSCPAHVDVDGYISLIKEKKYEDALRLIKEHNPLPLVCGHVCTRPCEDSCRRHLVDEPVGIDYLKRFLAEYDMNNERFIPAKKPATGKKIAIIGAGPAGLACAWYSLLNGHSVTIFEQNEKAGGMLRYGIPAYRLPRDLLDYEISLFTALGAKIEYNKAFGKDIAFDSLKENGYDALFLGIGAQKGRGIGAPGEEGNRRVLTGVDFLARVEKKSAPTLEGKTVIVVGGGNTAIDAARTSVRLGAKEVKIIYRRSKEDMPAHKEEINEAINEGVTILPFNNPVEIKNSSDGLLVTCVKMAEGEPDQSGRKKPMPIKGSEWEQYADYLFAAVGQEPIIDFIDEAFPLETKWGKIEISPTSGATSIKGVFAGGDAVTGPATAIEAIAAGAKSAAAINAYLLNIEETIKPEYNHTKGKKLSNCDKREYELLPKKEKIIPFSLPLKERHNFNKVEQSFTEDQALKEADRCLHCSCLAKDDCQLRSLSAKYGASQYSFTNESFAPANKDYSHPVFIRDKNKCILCGKCIRVCNEKAQVGMLGLIGRGSNSYIDCYLPGEFKGERACINCKLCVSACPTGALTLKNQK